MGKFLMLWEIDLSRMPVNPAERGQLYNQLLQSVKNDMKKGLKDWGFCVGNNRGHAIFEGSEADLGLLIEQYIPYVRFKTYLELDVEATEKMSQAMMQMRR
ncbi:MAG: hypothetical protein AVW06_02885 [Hadesarchaea archaeon DG-33-1]|nr:MAG: hypothetical protein AVW06_02885 [Hadesarchaea archaeon DG-33-1]